MIDTLYLLLYRFFALLVKLLPTKLLNTLLKALSSLAYVVSPKRRQIIESNLNHVFGDTLKQEEKTKIAKRTFYNLAQTVIGIIKREDMSKEELLATTTFVNDHIVTEALKENRKIVFFTAHYSNWEQIPPLLTSKFGFRLTGVGRKLDSASMDTILVDAREKFNIEMLYRRDAIKNSIKALKKGNVLGLLLDQHLGEKQGGIEVEFLGKPAMQSPAASVLARMMDALIIPAFITTDDYNHYTLTFYTPQEPIKTENKEEDIATMTQLQSDAMSEVILQKPDEWFWVHKRFKGFYDYKKSEGSKK